MEQTISRIQLPATAINIYVSVMLANYREDFENIM